MQTVTVLANHPVVVLTVVVAGLVSPLAGCSSGGDRQLPAASDTASTPVDTSPGASVTAPDVSVTADVPENTSGTNGASSTVAVIPDSGVPGLDSEDGFCRAWSEFAGSFQALALASSASDPIGAARAEVAAAPVVVAAVGQLGVRLPRELEPERKALTVELTGPMARRAARAVDAMDAAGLDADQIDEVGAAWLVALAEAGLDDPNIDVAVASSSVEGFEAAVAEFTRAVPPIAQDPSLITDASTPLTFAYLAANCPDQGTLGGNDIVDQP